MSELEISQPHASSNPIKGQRDQNITPPKPSPAPNPTLIETMRRGWDWVVFIWRMGNRLGGPIEVLKTIGTVLSLLIRRTLIQWGWMKSR